MTKTERFNAVRQMKSPDYMPVWPRSMSQLIFSMGWQLSEVTGKDWYCSDKCTEAVLWNLKSFDYDVAIPAYMDSGFGIPPLGGDIHVPSSFKDFVCVCGDKPVKTKNDWPKVKRRLAKCYTTSSDPRMKGALDTIRKVSTEVGDTTPLVTTCYVAATAAMLLFRDNELFLYDMVEDPKWVDSMCRVAAEWTKDWVRAQYEAGANSVTFVADPLGTFMVAPKMAQRFNLPYLGELVQVVQKEFNQGVWLHIHGNMKLPANYEYLEKIVHEAGVEGIQLDGHHSPEWIMENVKKKLGVSSCIVYPCDKIVRGPVQKIRADIKDMVSEIGGKEGIMMAPCCQVLPQTPNRHFKAWVDATHEFGRYSLQP